MDPHEQNKREHARHIADALRHARTEHRFDRLMLVAPPHFLGLLRGALDDETGKLVVASHDKDLTALDGLSLEERLRGFLEESA